jgi:hypothetical protein
VSSDVERIGSLFFEEEEAPMVEDLYPFAKDITKHTVHYRKF